MMWAVYTGRWRRCNLSTLCLPDALFPSPPHSLFWHIIITFWSRSISSRTDNFILQWIHTERYKLIYLTYNAMLPHTTGTSHKLFFLWVIYNVLWQIYFFAYLFILYFVFWDEINIPIACALIIKLNVVAFKCRQWMEFASYGWS